MTEQEIYRKALEKRGLRAQCEMAIEECGELIVEISHMYRGQKCNVFEEIADVQIMMEQLSVAFGKQLVEKIKSQKLERLSKILSK